MLVIGAGAAGLCAAIKAQEAGARVTVAAATRPGRANATAVAGGLINAALAIADPEDTVEQHYHDTMQAGGWLGEPALVGALVERIVEFIPILERYGVNLARLADGRFYQFLSPGHSRPRTLVTYPRRGTSLSLPLARRAQQLGVKFLPGFTAARIGLHDGQVAGVLGYRRDTDEVCWIAAQAIVLATGGAGLLYDRSRIPPLCLGNGVGLALEAGAEASDMEFVQFYPTILNEPDAPRMTVDYLVALSQGARLVNAAGEDIVSKYGLPAPAAITRDALAVALGRELHAGLDDGGSFWLDCACYQPPAGDYPSRFEEWLGSRLEQGITRVRVSPFCHYFLGGIRVDARGYTGVPGLFACGEVTGDLHGGNRLQGNALAETVVFGFLAGEQAARFVAGRRQPDFFPETWKKEFRRTLWQPGEIQVDEVLAALQETMSRNVGLVREAAGLARAASTVTDLISRLPQVGARTPQSRAKLAALPGLLATAACIVAGAQLREVSYAAHYRLDAPSGAMPGVYKVIHRRQGGQNVTSKIPWPES